MNFNLPDLNKLNQELFDGIRKTKEYDSGFANIFFKQLIESINRFDARLDNTRETGIRLVSYGNIIQFSIEAVGYKDPYLIFFYGHLEDGSPIQLIQHVSQISFVLIALKRNDPEKPKTPIGFRSE